MTSIPEPARQVPILAEIEVLVVGSGPGGLAAAIAAARQGAQTMLVERYGCFGGTITQVGVESIAWYRYEGTIDVEGIGIEFEQRARVIGGTMPFYRGHSELLDAELFKVVADQLVLEAGVTPLLHAYAVDALCEGPIVRGVIVESKSGRQAILAQRVIDATGDADIAYRAGAPCHILPKQERMGVTVMFSCSGVDRERFLAYVESRLPTIGEWHKDWGAETSNKESTLFSPYLGEVFDRARAEGLIPPEMTSIDGTWSALHPNGDATGLNLVYLLGYDATDVRDLTRAEIEGRRQVMLAIEALRRYAPGWENARLRNFGMRVGVRDTRKIIGESTISEQDVRNQGRFADAIGIFPEFIDGYGVVVLPTTGRFFQVPYRILLPQKVENLLVAGRCVAGDKVSHTALRSMMACTVTGQGAGVAAAVSLQQGASPRRVSITQVQAALRQQGVRLA